jgi:hypothetical protein
MLSVKKILVLTFFLFLFVQMNRAAAEITPMKPVYPGTEIHTAPRASYPIGAMGSEIGIFSNDSNVIYSFLPGELPDAWVAIRPQDEGFQLYRYGEPYYIKGVAGTGYMEKAQASGANSVRTWGSQNAAAILDRAQNFGLTVLQGIWLSHQPDDYFDDSYRNRLIAEVQDLLDTCKHHPALLMWSLGNEINLEGADIPEAWQFVNQLARLIKTQDPHHPVITVISYSDVAFDHIAKYAPDLDAVGINAYGALSQVRAIVDNSAYRGPYLVTEWGTQGHWEAARTAWGRPIEPTSARKVELYRRFYADDILGNKDRCLGSYVFLWGQKQERTPTWYSMFIDHIPGTDFNGLACPTVDVMGYNWSGTWPSNRAPLVTDVTINGSAAHGDVSLFSGELMEVQVEANDPDQENLSYLWEIMEEPAILGLGGSGESRPATIGSVLQAENPLTQIQAPEIPGSYRLFVYVLDENGHVGTANIPFHVGTYQADGETNRGPHF